MIKNRKLELITLFAVIGFIIVFLSVSAGGTHTFAGSDTAGSEKVAELTGRSVDSFTPLIPLYVPPSTEIEATLFALQAALGGVVLGMVFGYWLGQRKSSANT
ncbi:energy-coupling factor ABC transporter substrate-binding protein [uncultured Methanoregula sp.]|uniref:energy-coupling factor ABC transporter substrate-binding protein n=1 Tax=uncultured Methanoregula sp. TaxID=1005933 RepID=UPI002AAA8127|nr:energy-coupling factor ABC transporter substrate-binding protein [uncultured Methanoregula sp.]